MTQQPDIVSPVIRVDTPEHIQFEFETAGPGQRMLAYLIDLAIRVAVMIAFALIVVSLNLEGLGVGLLLVAYFALEWLYYTILEWVFGASPGKKALNLRVVRTNGVPVDIFRSAMRNLLRLADAMPAIPLLFGDALPHPTYAFGLLFMFIRKDNRRLGDLAADTMVVRHRREVFENLPALPTERLALTPAQIRAAGISGEDLGVLDAFFRRKRFYGDERAREIAEILAAPMRAKLNLPNMDAELLLAGVLSVAYDADDAMNGAAQ